MLAAVLDAAGHDVICASNGLEAIARLRDDAEIAVMITNGNLPLMHGVSLLRVVGGRVRAIGITGDPETWRDRMLAAGASIVLEKPFSIEELLAAVEGTA